MALSPEHAQMSATELRVGTPDILPVDMQPISKETPAHSKIPVSAPGAAEVVEEPCPDADHLTQATSKSLTSEKRKASDDACKEQAKKHKGMENQDVRTVQVSAYSLLRLSHIYASRL
ncbi:uncharacterized protein B0H18DRAFT_160095 [Fomitopsis serialis]|uniref:uncharacterized protein n=1 Tax=Fomitopsis serialis TaxID=139415 RepID=UPI002007A400|nr:uncharacterized protein B0H18DRAFT_160095 [Neoantrodia serialis]KAH9930048.1 hypothetical protein B0H18DRAFT_160095 [Neoantrodia serialis]